MVRINITGNPRIHKLAYGRGIVSVSKSEAEKLVGFGVAEYLDEPKSDKPSDIEVAVATPVEVETADLPIKAKSRPKRKRKR